MDPEHKKRRPPRPIESYGPELMAALLKGAVDTFTMEMPFQRAVRFRQRIYQLRFAMESQGHPKYNLVSRVRTTIRWPEGTELVPCGHYFSPKDRTVTCQITISPNDSEFADDLRKAGVTVGPPEDEVEDEVPIAPDERRDLLDSLFGERK